MCLILAQFLNCVFVPLLYRGLIIAFFHAEGQVPDTRHRLYKFVNGSMSTIASLQIIWFENPWMSGDLVVSRCFKTSKTCWSLKSESSKSIVKLVEKMGSVEVSLWGHVKTDEKSLLKCSALSLSLPIFVVFPGQWMKLRMETVKLGFFLYISQTCLDNFEQTQWQKIQVTHDLTKEAKKPFIFQMHPVKILRQPFCSA